MHYLFVVDLQHEFVKDKVGKQVYDKCLKYIAENQHVYDAVLAPVYVNRDLLNMERLVGWNECKQIAALDFVPTTVYYHSGYSIPTYPGTTPYDEFDIIGFDTDACVLSAAFDIFNMDCKMRILTDLCWSSGGKDMHKAAIKIMKRQFGSAVV